MSDDILNNIDAAVESAREDVCACACGRPLRLDSGSLYFAGPDCQASWYLQQQAIAAGEPERAEEMRRQRGEDPIARLRRRARELGPSDEERAERERLRLRVVDWLRANGIDPMRVAESYPIITTPTAITVHDYTRDEDDQICLVDGAVETVELMYPLVVPWPADLDWEYHRFEPDEDEGDAHRRRGEVFTSVAGAVRLLGRGERLDATTLTYDHPFLYQIRCTGCGRRGTPVNAETRLTTDGSLRTSWICDCGAHASTSEVTAAVERFTQADGLHLRLSYGGETVHYVLPEHLIGRYDSLDSIWREMEQLIATSVRLPWSDPRSNPLRDMQEVVERSQVEGRAVSVGPVGTPPGGPGWVDVGYISGPDGLEPVGEVVLGFDGAADGTTSLAVAYRNTDGRMVARGYHNPEPGWIRSWDLDAPLVSARRWREAVRQFQLTAEQAGMWMRLIAGVTGRAAEQLNPMLRAIEAKKNQAHGPQRKKRAPRRIDPRRGR